MTDSGTPPARIVADTFADELLETVTALQVHWRADLRSPHTSAWLRQAAEMLLRLTGITLELTRMHKINRNGRCLGCPRQPPGERCPVTQTLVRYATGPTTRVWTMLRDDSRGQIIPPPRLIAPDGEPRPGVEVIDRATVAGG